jgi:hypothetical protein
MAIVGSEVWIGAPNAIATSRNSTPGAPSSRRRI